jgi:hypothetical protein
VKRRRPVRVLVSGKSIALENRDPVMTHFSVRFACEASSLITSAEVSRDMARKGCALTADKSVEA